ncbi:MAG TPA: ATP synthase F1 subunit gamma [Feifaniaceae bacterium]|nr:ATP synthase F1 subunit gamma [Feifaniaceae bacterium]
MPSMSDIRFHIKSVKQTRQITNAMHLVSAARMRRALRGIEQNRLYFYRAVDVMQDILAHTGNTTHPYIKMRENANRVAYIVVAGEKGLSGSYNHDILALANKSMAGRSVAQVFTVGNVATQHFMRRNITVNESFAHIAEDPSVNTARRIVAILMELYDKGEIDEVRIVFTRFVNSMVHEPADQKLLPLELADFIPERAVPEDRTEMLYEPSPLAVFEALVPQFMIGFVYGAMVHAYASENYARMAAMENATRSADEMIEKLTQQYHSVRQLSITNELAEIVSAADAFDPEDR